MTISNRNSRITNIKINKGLFIKEYLLLLLIVITTMLIKRAGATTTKRNLKKYTAFRTLKIDLLVET